MTTNLPLLDLRLRASGCGMGRFVAEIFRTQSTTLERSDAKHVLNAANAGSGGIREMQRLLRPTSNGTRTGRALAGGTLSGAYPVNFVGNQNEETPGCAVLSLSNAGCAVPEVHERQIGRQLSRSGGLAATN